MAKNTSLTVSYVWSLGLHSLQSRDINAVNSRYGIYSGAAEIGSEYEVVGYGPAGKDK